MRCSPIPHQPQVPRWSLLGRLKRLTFPKLTGGGHSFGGGASPGVAAVVAGRLLCDTYLISRELVGGCAGFRGGGGFSDGAI